MQIGSWWRRFAMINYLSYMFYRGKKLLPQFKKFGVNHQKGLIYLEIEKSLLSCYRWRNLHTLHTHAVVVRLTVVLFVIVFHCLEHLVCPIMMTMYEVNARTDEHYNHRKQHQNSYLTYFFHYNAKLIIYFYLQNSCFSF